MSAFGTQKLCAVRGRLRSVPSRSLPARQDIGQVVLRVLVGGQLRVAGTGPSFSSGSSGVRLSSRLQPSASTS